MSTTIDPLRSGLAASATPRWKVDSARTGDLDEAVHTISSVFCPHDLVIMGPRGDFEVEIHARYTESITVAEISHGTEVIVRPSRMQSHYQVGVPIRGGSLLQCGHEEVESTPKRAVVLALDGDASMHWSADCAQLAVEIGRTAVERCLEGILGYAPDEAVRFDVPFDVGDGVGRDWVNAVTLLRDAVDRGAPELVLRPLEDLVIGQLLAAQPNNFSGRLAGEARPARPRFISRAVDLIESDPASPHTVADLAQAAGTSVRSLQSAFAEYLGLSPMEYLRRVRLSRAHADLERATAADGLSVANIAYRWGFGHVSRFASVYAARYGRSPSQTLRG
ncbi:AraC family transcriptional regulator [Tsukamurella sputi]|nr:AraC family transcriptional regulator [Tsukamurella sputi]